MSGFPTNQELALRLSCRLRKGPNANSDQDSHSCGISRVSYIFGFRDFLFKLREKARRDWRHGGYPCEQRPGSADCRDRVRSQIQLAPSKSLLLGPPSMGKEASRDAANLIDSRLALGTKNGYVFHYVPNALSESFLI